MKRTHPLLLRLGYNRIWLNHFNVVNYGNSIPIMIKSSEYLFNWLNSCKLTKKNSIFMPLEITSFINNSSVVLYLKYFFITRKIFIKKRKKKLYSRFFFSNILWKFENIFWKKFKISLKIIKFNIYKIAFSKTFFSMLSKLKKKIVWKRIQIESLVFSLLYALYYKNPIMLSLIIAGELKKRKEHALTGKILSHILTSLLRFLLNVKGLCFQISGRWNNKDRTNSKFFMFGKRPKFQYLDFFLNYAFNSVVTPIGVFGIKVWIF